MAGIFKAYDIRGLYPEELDEPLAHNIGRAFAELIGRGPVAVAYDMRTSGPSLAERVIAGITDCGVDVVDLGQCSTPLLNFAVAFRKLAGGVMITASHNPGRYNGMKLCREEGIPISGDTGIAEIERWVRQEHLDFTPAPERGRVTREDPKPAYGAFFRERVTLGDRPLKVVIDSGNGMTGPIEVEILRGYLPRLIGMYLEPDGTFPNHEANPLVEKNLADLKAAVVRERADAGIAFDGDGDRVAFIDETGATVPGDLLLALMAQRVLAAHPGAPVLYDLRSSWAVKEEIERAGGVPVLSRVGHAFIKKTLRDRDGVLGGEVSGHYYFRDLWYLDSGILAALRVLELLSRSDATLSQLIRPLDRYARTGEVNFIVKDANAALERLEGAFAKAGQAMGLDGLSVEFDDWWFNVRKSNTEPLLRLNAEARTPELLAAKVAELERLIGGERH
jgi:phosphomannomutase